MANFDRLPRWLQQIPSTESRWPVLEQTLANSHANTANSVSFSPDGQLLASSSQDMVKVWSAQTGQVQQTLLSLNSDAIIYHVVFSPDGKLLAASSYDQTNTYIHWIILFSVQTGQVQHELQVYSAKSPSVAFTPDGQLLTTDNYNGWIVLRSVQTGQVQQTVTYDSEAACKVTLSPDGQLLIVDQNESNSESTKVWSVQAGQIQQTFMYHYGDFHLAFSPSEQLLASRGLDKKITLWSLQTGRIQQTLVSQTLPGPFGFSAAFSSDGRLLASGGSDRKITLWSVQTGQVLQTFVGHLHKISSVAFSPDGQLLASGSWDGTTKLWSVQIEQTEQNPAGHLTAVESIRVSSKDQTVQSISGSDRLQWHIPTDRVTQIEDPSPLSLLMSSKSPNFIHRLRQYLGPESSKCLKVKDQWLHYGSTRILLFPPYYRVTCYDEDGEYAAFGFENGQVWYFAIDHESLAEVLTE